MTFLCCILSVHLACAIWYRCAHTKKLNCHFNLTPYSMRFCWWKCKFLFASLSSFCLCAKWQHFSVRFMFFLFCIGMPQLLPCLTRYCKRTIWIAFFCGRNHFVVVASCIWNVYHSFDSIIYCQLHVIQSMHRLTMYLMNLEPESCEFIFNISSWLNELVWSYADISCFDRYMNEQQQQMDNFGN